MVTWAASLPSYFSFLAQRGLAGVVEGAEGERTGDGLPQRVGGVGGHVLGGLVQVGEDLLGALGGAVRVADLALVAGLGPGVVRQRPDRGQLRGRHPVLVVDLVEGQGEGRVIGVVDVGDVVRKTAFLVAAPGFLVRLDEVEPELDVAGGDGGAIGPVHVAQVEGDRLAVCRVVHLVGDAGFQVQLHLALGAVEGHQRGPEGLGDGGVVGAPSCRRCRSEGSSWELNSGEVRS